MRLDKYISKALQLSRADAIKMIQAGKITVNDMIIKKKDHPVIEEKDQIKYNNELIEYRKFEYFMLNKPQGVVSAVTDDRDSTVVDLIKERKDIYPVGRLDKDVEGLLLITNNGKLAHLLTSPKHKVIKKYYVRTKNRLVNDDIEKFNTGFEIKDGNEELFKTMPALLEIIDEYSCYLSIHEGKFHQVKRMFLANDNEVLYLKRVAMGNIELDNNLKLGQYRNLNDQEIKAIKEMVDLEI